MIKTHSHINSYREGKINWQIERQTDRQIDSETAEQNVKSTQVQMNWKCKNVTEYQQATLTVVFNTTPLCVCWKIHMYMCICMYNMYICIYIPSSIHLHRQHKTYCLFVFMNDKLYRFFSVILSFSIQYFSKTVGYYWIVMNIEFTNCLNCLNRVRVCLQYFNTFSFLVVLRVKKYKNHWLRTKTSSMAFKSRLDIQLQAEPSKL